MSGIHNNLDKSLKKRTYFLRKNYKVLFFSLIFASCVSLLENNYMKQSICF